MGMGMGMGERRGDDVAERLLGLAVAALRVAGALKKDVAGRHVSLQLIRAGTAGGANYEEARAAESKNDFVHKIGVAAKEVRETLFWLKLVKQASMFDGSLDQTLKEADELTAILIASARTARSKPT
jgi:four helix bundle protein